jgi:hypothetical protein
MPKYVVEEGAGGGKVAASHGPFEGLAVAKAVARKTADESGRPAIVRDVDSGQSLARFEPSPKVETPEEPASLAHSVRRMRAANDELQKALTPLTERSKKG